MGFQCSPENLKSEAKQQAQEGNDPREGAGTPQGISWLDLSGFWGGAAGWGHGWGTQALGRALEPHLTGAPHPLPAFQFPRAGQLGSTTPPFHPVSPADWAESS